MTRVTAILFDWDGTLLDSFPAGFHASRAVAESFGIPFDRESFMATYNPNWYETYRQVGLPEQDWPRADRIWRDSYDQRRSDLYPFARKTLTTLAGHGYVLGLVTSGDRDRVQRELAFFGLTEAFAAVVCHEDSAHKKPHPAPLLAALGALDRAPRQAVFVGDRPEDIHMGRGAGTYTVGVESAYGRRADLERAAPDLLLPHAGHLPGHFGPIP